jgi:hypothetical protein
MTTSISVTNFQTALGNCYDSISSGDFAAAWKYYAMAEAQHSGLAMQLSDAGMTTQRRQSLDGLAKAITAAENAGNASTDDERRLISTQTRHSS